MFAGAPGHPALREICDHINRHATTVSPVRFCTPATLSVQQALAPVSAVGCVRQCGFLIRVLSLLQVFSNNTNRDTLERTGPGVWTDVILRHALSHPPSNVRNISFEPCGVLPPYTRRPLLPTLPAYIV